MRYATFVIAYLVFLMTGAAFWQEAKAEPAGAEAAANNAKREKKGNEPLGDPGKDLAIVFKQVGEQKVYQYKFGESIRIKATGEYKKKIDEALKKANAVVLYLDGVRMASLTVSTSLAPDGSARYLDYRLWRDAQNAESRDQWKAFLGKQRRFDMHPELALLIDAEGPYLLRSDFGQGNKFQFNVTTAEKLYVVIAIGVIIFFVAYWLLVRHPSALRDTTGGYYSLGKSQMAFWGLVVFLTFGAVLFVTGAMESLPGQVLVLLGISGATGLSAIAIGENKEARGKADVEEKLTKLRDEKRRLEERGITSPSTFTPTDVERLEEIEQLISELEAPPPEPTSRGFWRDICDDGNGMSIHRLQVVAWTVLLGGFFVYSVSQVISMPEFSETLLTLMGISNLTYLGFKLPEKA